MSRFAPTRKKRMQRGQVIERSGRFYVRFYDSEGKMVARWICDKDAKHHSKTCKPVRLKQQEPGKTSGS